MESLHKYTLEDTRETIDRDSHYNTFEVLMKDVDEGKLSFEQAIEAYRRLELNAAAQATLAQIATNAA